MPSLTRRRCRETTRKLDGWSALLASRSLGGGWTPTRFRRLGVKPPHLLTLAILMVAGCATSGPNHVYFTTATAPEVHDLGPSPKLLAGIVRPGEQVLGLAYDFNTDHLFLRIAPAQVIRVVERPSGKILREMPLSQIHDWNEKANADLAIRSRDRNLFVVVDENAVAEFTLFGRFIWRPELAGLEGPIGGLAFDQNRDCLVILINRAPARIGFVVRGMVTNYVTLDQPVNAVSLGYDSDAQHFFVPLADGQTLGEFDISGHLVASHPAGGGPITAIDAGPRSFVRVF